MSLWLWFFSVAHGGSLIIANNFRVTYDFGHEIKPYIANEVKFISDGTSSSFDANKFRIGARYKISDSVRIDPHLAVDNKRKNDWKLAVGPEFRLDLTF